jgi:glycosyltransferase involved in cell wall biosynthesis
MSVLKLSVITINYNNQKGLAKTMESVAAQRWQQFEYVVIDGGSIDGSKDLIIIYLKTIKVCTMP